MVPFPMLPSESSAERRLFEGFLAQLDDEYVVYHSVDWVQQGPRGPKQGEADFVLAHPENGVLVLEVKGGGLRYDPATRRWTQIGRSGGHVLDEDPFHQARDEMHSLAQILQARPGWERWKPSYGYGVAFPDGRYDTDAHPGAPAAVVIDRNDLGRLSERVREVMGHWRREGRRFGQPGMDELAAALGFRVEIRTSLGLRFDEEDKRIVELSNEQGWVRSMLLRLKRAGVVGPAGSGKTLLALEVAKRLAAQGQRTLLTCFNRRLAEHLEASTAGTSKLHVRHFHRLCHETAVEAGLEVRDVIPTEDTAYFDHELPGLLEQAARALGPRFDAMVVDEAQDFREWWWPALLALHADPDAGRLYVFSDDNQNLYGGELPLSEGDPVVPLPDNHRNTRRIHEFLSVFYRSEEPARGRGPDGRPVEVLPYRDMEDLVRLLPIVLRNLVEGEGVPLEDIVLLTPARRSKSPLRQLEAVDGFRLSEQPEPGVLLTATVHAFKGLEHPVVILAELEERHEERLEQYLYVGGSRARNHLIVLATEPIARKLRAITGTTGP